MNNFENRTTLTPLWGGTPGQRLKGLQFIWVINDRGKAKPKSS